MKRAVLCIALLVLLVNSCHYSNVDDDSDFGKFIQLDPSFLSVGKRSYPDEMIIPDKYNTGVDSTTLFSKITESQSVNGLYILRRTDTNQYCVTSHGQNHVTNRDGTLKSEMADRITIENYDFSDLPFIIQNGERFSRKKTITFKNCKFKGFRNPPGEDNKVWVSFVHCSFSGGVNEAQISMDYCYIGGFTADGMNPTRYFKCRNSYISNLMTERTQKEVHVDGFQIYGRKNIAGGNICFDNVRFEIPSIDVLNQHKGTEVNACFMFQLEYGNVDNCLFTNLFINGGGRWFPMYLQDGKRGELNFSQKNLVLKNIYVSNNFGKIFYTGTYDSNATVINVAHRNSMYVSSVWKDDAGKTHIICSNDTIFKGTLLVKTNLGDYRFPIPRCPSNWNLRGEPNGQRTPEQKAAGLVDDPNTCMKDENGKLYTSYKFNDMPFDIDCVINENVSEITCFDEEENLQIRHVRF